MPRAGTQAPCSKLMCAGLTCMGVGPRMSPFGFQTRLSCETSACMEFFISTEIPDTVQVVWILVNMRVTSSRIDWLIEILTTTSFHVKGPRLKARQNADAIKDSPLMTRREISIAHNWIRRISSSILHDKRHTYRTAQVCKIRKNLTLTHQASPQQHIYPSFRGLGREMCHLTKINLPIPHPIIQNGPRSGKRVETQIQYP